MSRKATSDHCSVFISYKETEGGVLASILKRKLNRKKLDAFVARDDLPVTLRLGTDKYKRRIHGALEACTYIVVLLTPNIDSDEVIQELGYALSSLRKGQEKYFLLCRHESVRQSFSVFARKLGFDPGEYTHIMYRRENDLARKLLGQLRMKGWLKDKSDAKKIAMDLSKKRYRVLVIGDVMLDHVIYGSKAKFREVLKHGLTEVYLQESLLRDEKEPPIRPEGSSPETFSPGGAAWLATVLSQVAEVTLFGLLGSKHTSALQLDKTSNELDFEGKRLVETLTDKVNFEYLLTNEAPTICKNYFYTFGGEPSRYLGIRVDRENGKLMKKEVGKALEGTIIETLKKLIGDQRPDAMVIDDYEKGLIAPNIIREIAQAAQDVPLFIDPKYDWGKFKGIKVQAFLPNTKEALFGLGLDEEEIQSFLDRKQRLKTRDFQRQIMSYDIKGLLDEKCNEVVIKADQHGTILLVKGTDDEPKHWFVDPLASDKFITGVCCGGVFDSFYIASRIARNAPLISAMLANFAAGLRVKKQLGKPISPNEAQKEMDENPLYFKGACKDNPRYG